VNSQIETGGTQGGGNVGIGFAVPIDTAKRIVPELKKSGRVERGYLGISSITIDSSLSDLNLPVAHGALVQSVQPGSPAADAGIKAGDIQAQLNGDQIQLGGDIITAIDGKKVVSKDDVSNAITAKKQGDKVTLTILRAGKKKSVQVTLANRPTQVQGQP